MITKWNALQHLKLKVKFTLIAILVIIDHGSNAYSVECFTTYCRFIFSIYILPSWTPDLTQTNLPTLTYSSLFEFLVNSWANVNINSFLMNLLVHVVKHLLYDCPKCNSWLIGNSLIDIISFLQDNPGTFCFQDNIS